MGRASRVGALAVCASLLASTCSNGSPERTRTPTSCTRDGRPSTPEAEPIPGSVVDWTIASFDGTKIRVHWFPHAGASERRRFPSVLVASGWATPGDTGSTGVGAYGELSIPSLQRAGYNVLTWDARGFGASTGTSQFNSVDFEARDVQTILDWLATRPGVQVDGPGDPRVGMAGHSYGGAIQLVVAAIDCRVEAIVPALTWSSLATSLAGEGLLKRSWLALLLNLASNHRVDPHLAASFREARTTGVLGTDNLHWYETRGPGELIRQVRAPTLLIQGTVDTLFTLREAVETYRALRARRVPLQMFWYCGGHGVCLTRRGDTARSQQLTIAWLDRYVKGDQRVVTRPAFEVIDQNGDRHSSDNYPPAPGESLIAHGHGKLALVGPAGGSGLAEPPADVVSLGSAAAATRPSRASHAVNVRVVGHADSAVIVGAPRLRLAYHGTSSTGIHPAYAFAQIVDETTGLVLGNQVTPFTLELDGANHVSVEQLEIVVHAPTPATRLTLQIVAASAAFAPPRFGGTVTFDDIELILPTARDM